MASKTREERSVICISSIHLHLAILFQAVACTGIISGAQAKRLSRSFNSRAPCISRASAETSGYSFLRDNAGYAEIRHNQDYSVAKKNSAGIEGPKGALWWQIDDIIREKRPSYILLENVDRLIRSPAKQQGRDFSIILRCLYEKGYAAEWRVINAADYGQAQRRRRTFILAYHNDTQIFKFLAEDVCIRGLKAFHQQVMMGGVLSKAFPIASHSRIFSESWIDE